MSKIFKKFTILALLFLSMLTLSGCDGSGCIYADEYNTKYVKVESNPTNDGVFGSYNDTDGGQTANWHETGLRTSNEDFIIMVSGAWVPWKTSIMSQKLLQETKECNICAKKDDDISENCICFQHKLSPDYKGDEGINPAPEKSISGQPLDVDCSLRENQNNPNLCTCTTFNGRADDYGVYHFPLNYYNKDHIRKDPDFQDGVCKYTRGLGLYLGVFGRTSNETPLRAYHLFSEEEICAGEINQDGECLNEDGSSALKYIFRSQNQRTFVKDDNAGNDGSDNNTSDDIYHKANEYVKLIIYDRYYHDNFGHYNVEFIKGVMDDDDIGLLEFLVRTVEDAVLGDLKEDGTREGGVIEFMYKALTKDFNFLITLQVLMILYVSFFGLAYLLGLTEFNKKEVYGRVLKIGIVIFFTSPESWQFYNDIVVRFFKDGMDYVISFFMSLGEINLDKETNPLVIAQLGNTTPGSIGSRFNYPDIMLRTLFSEPVTKKIWSLFFSSFFGLVYIAAIYALILYFLYVMITAASVYIIAVLKIVFALALGPIFIPLMLFKITNDIFKKWVSFVAARSLEMIILFLVLYTLVSLLDKRFYELLHYPACYDYISLGLFSFKILLADHGRNLADWTGMMVVLAIMIFLSDMILQQIPNLSGAIVSIGGVGSMGGDGSGHGASGFALGRSIAGEIFSGSKEMAKWGAKNIGGNAFRLGRKASRASGLSSAIDKIGDKIPIRGLRTRMRDNIINNALSKARTEGQKNGLKGSALDKFVRDNALNNKNYGINVWRQKNPNKSALYDFDNKKMQAALDRKLVDKPLRKFLKDRAKELRKQDAENIPLGKEMRNQLREDAKKWANENLYGGADSIKGNLTNLDKFMQEKGEFSTKKAIKKFGKDEDLKAKYLAHLKGKHFDKFDKLKGKKAADKIDRASKKMKKFMRGSNNDELSFAQRLMMKDRMTSRPDFLKSKAEKARSLESKSQAQIDAAKSYLKGGYERDLAQNRDFYDKKIAEAQQAHKKIDSRGDKKSSQERLYEAKRQKEEEKLKQKRDFFKQVLANEAKKKAQRDFDEALKQDRLNVNGGGNLAKLQQDALQKLQDARLQSQELMDKHKQEIQGLVGDADWKEKLSQYGNKYALQYGLSENADGDNLFELEARNAVLNSADAANPSQLGQDSVGSAISQVSQANQALEDLDKYLDQDARGEAPMTKEQVEQVNSALIQEADLKFGASIQDAFGLGGGDFTPKAGNVGIGGNVQAENSADDKFALLAAFESGKVRKEAEIRLKKFDKKSLELEKYNLEKENKPENAAKINALTKEIGDIDHEISEFNRELDIIENQIKNVG